MRSHGRNFQATLSGVRGCSATSLETILVLRSTLVADPGIRVCLQIPGKFDSGLSVALLASLVTTSKQRGTIVAHATRRPATDHFPVWVRARRQDTIPFMLSVLLARADRCSARGRRRGRDAIVTAAMRLARTAASGRLGRACA